MSRSRPSDSRRGAGRNAERGRRGGLLLAAPLTLALLLAAPAAAHAYLTASDPVGGSVVHAPPERVTLTMSEAVELRFSTFKVLRLDDPPADRRARIDAAEALTDAAILRRDDGAARVDTGVLGDATPAAEITLGLMDGLEPGTYVVMWRVLSVDTHTSQDFTLFRYDPEAAPAAAAGSDAAAPSGDATDPAPATPTEPVAASEADESHDRDDDADSGPP